MSQSAARRQINQPPNYSKRLPAFHPLRVGTTRAPPPFVPAAVFAVAPENPPGARIVPIRSASPDKSTSKLFQTSPGIPPAASWDNSRSAAIRPGGRFRRRAASPANISGQKSPPGRPFRRFSSKTGSFSRFDGFLGGWRRGQTSLPAGKLRLPEGKSSLPAGKSRLPEGKSRLPEGKSRLPAGKSRLPGKRTSLPGKKSRLPGKQTLLSGGKLRLPGKQTLLPGGKLSLPLAQFRPTAGDPPLAGVANGHFGS